MFSFIKSLLTPKKKPVQDVQPEAIETPYEPRVISIDSVVDGQWFLRLTKIEGYLTDDPINETSKLIRHQDDWQFPVIEKYSPCLFNKFFTKK